jgi:hypothetical protein
MFVEAHTTLPMPVDAGRVAVEHALAGHALQQRSTDAVAEGLDLALTVGPRSAPFAKEVRAHTLDTRLVGRTFVIPLRWEATGAARRLYPVLDANIGLTPVDDVTCVLSVIGTYTPPLGVLGTTLDRAAMSRLAAATIDAFLAGLATEATSHVPAETA